MQADTPSPRRGFLANTFFSLISWFFPLCLAFVATPILVRSLGNEAYGLFAIFQGFLSFAFSTGVGRVVAKYIPEYRTAGDSEKLASTLSATLWLSLGIGLAQAILLAALAPFLVTDILLIPEENQGIAVASLYIAALAGLAMMMSQVFQSALHGQHRFDSYAVLTNLSGLLLSVGNIALALKGFGVVALAFWNLTVAAIFAVLFFLAARRGLDELRIRLRFPTEIFRSVARYSGSIVVYQGLTSLLFAFERTWIVRKAGAESLTFYVIPLMLAIYMHGMLVNLLYVLFPAANELLNDPERLEALYKRATKAAVAIIAFTVAGYIVLGRAFLSLWVGEEFAANSYGLLVILGIAFGLNAVCIVVWMMAETFRAPGLNVLSTGMWVAAAIPLMVLLAERSGLEGIAAARLVGVTITVPLIFYIEKRFLGRVYWNFWLGIFLQASVAVGAAALVEYFALRAIGESWTGLILAGAGGAAAFASVLILTGYVNGEEREILKTALRRIGKKYR